MIKNVYYPSHMMRNGITKNHKGADMCWNVAAGDVETEKGTPYTLQLCFDGKNAEVYRVTPATIMDTFIHRITQWAERETNNVVYFHNLKFDMQALFKHPAHQHFFGGKERDFVLPFGAVDQDKKIKWLKGHNAIRRKKGLDPVDEAPAYRCYNQYMHVFADKTWFAKLVLPSHRTVWVVDSRAFFPGSLKAAAELVKSPFQKLDRPKDLGKRNLNGEADFEEYIVNDVLAQWHVGSAIRDLHLEHDVKNCVSVPHLSARIFRHQFLREGEAVGFPKPMDLVKGAEFSYHGGFNGWTVTPGWYDCTEIDIHSAYGWAMVNLPGMLEGTYDSVNTFEEVDAPGIVKVSGEVNCPYGCLFTHDFKPIHGRFRDIWTTTYELNGAIRCGCLTDITKCEGWVWHSTSRKNPFEAYVKHFWKLKEEAPKGSLKYVQAKLLMLALYGKTIQTTKVTGKDEAMIMYEDGDTDQEEIWKAGGIYNPVIGSFITGMVRMKLHDQLHAAEWRDPKTGKFWPPLHWSTDSIKTMRPVAELPDIGPELGQWGVEIEGPCLIFRPKLYVHTRRDAGDPLTCEGKKCPRCRGKGCAKSGFHGFHSNLKDLLDGQEAYLRGEEVAYFTEHCWTTRQALARKKNPVIPLNFERIPMVLRPPKGV